jgi:hypothetical protein
MNAPIHLTVVSKAMVEVMCHRDLKLADEVYCQSRLLRALISQCVTVNILTFTCHTSITEPAQTILQLDTEFLEVTMRERRVGKA